MSNIVIPDGGNIGSASDTDAISIASNGKPTFSAGIANTGTIDAGNLGPNVTGTGLIESLTTFFINADITADTNPIPSSKYTNWNTTAIGGSIGTQVTCSDGSGGITDGYFIFPSTGIWLVNFNIGVFNMSSDNYVDWTFYYYDRSASSSSQVGNFYSAHHSDVNRLSQTYCLDITDATDNLYFSSGSITSGSTILGGTYPNNIVSTILFYKIGPT